MSDALDPKQTPAPPSPEEKETYEGTPEELTAFEKGGGGPAWFDRKKVLVTLCIAFSVIVMLGIFLNIKKDAAKEAEDNPSGRAARTPRDFLQREYDRSLRQQPDDGEALAEAPEGEEEGPPAAETSGLPEAVPVTLQEPPRPAAPPPAPGGGGAPSSPPSREASSRKPSPRRSPRTLRADTILPRASTVFPRPSSASKTITRRKTTRPANRPFTAPPRGAPSPARSSPTTFYGSAP